MKRFCWNEFSIYYDTKQTKKCSIKLSSQLYIENIELPRYFIGEADLSFFDFYQADCPDLQETDYVLSEKFMQIIERFPHTNQEKIALNINSYVIKNVPIYMTASDFLLATIYPETYAECNKKLVNVQMLTSVMEDEIILLDSYKRKKLTLNGQYGLRELLAVTHKENVQPIQKKLEYVNELYYFGHYSYAAMVQFLPQYEIETYNQFHEAYGKSIYSVTITKNGKTFPLLWPDYLYHKPENHLEFGILANTGQSRYRSFNQWLFNEKISIEILAEGFEDVRFETRLKQPMIEPPKLSKTDYSLGESVYLSIDYALIEELRQGDASIQLISSKKAVVNNERLHYKLTDNHLMLFNESFAKTGRYQIKLYSKRYGQLLFLVKIKEED